jgi:hypothetical protein
MFGFKLFFNSFLLSESLSVKDYFKNNKKAEKIFEWLFNQQEIRDFIKKIDEISLIKPLTIGKSGVLVLKKGSSNFIGGNHTDDSVGNLYQHRIPVKIDEVDKTDLILSRTDGKDFDEISYLAPYFPDFSKNKSKNRILVPASRVILVNNERYLAFLKWIAYAISEGSTQKNMKISRYFRHFWRKSEENLLNSLKNDSLLSKLRTTDLKTDHFFKNNDEIDAPVLYSDVSRSFRGKKGGEGEEIISFPNGYRWINLKRSYCSQESDAAGHCGNRGGKENDEILSLRDKNNHVYLTFVLNEGKLGEMKAVGNKKPDKSLHPYIIKLLEQPFIKEVIGGNWLPRNDFKISDLSYEDFFRLKAKRPDLFSSSGDFGSTKLDEMLLKNRDRLVSYVKHLKSKHPVLKDMGVFYYDDKNHYFVVSDDKNHGTHSIRNYEYQKNWLGYAAKTLREWTESKNIPFYEIKNLPKGELKELVNYLSEIKNESFRQSILDLVSLSSSEKTNRELILEIISSEDNSLINEFFEISIGEDKNLAYIFNKTSYNSLIESGLGEINEKLKQCRNDYGFFFQIEVDRSGYLHSKKCINTSDVYDIMKTKDFVKEENEYSTIECLSYIDRPGIRADYFIEELKRNLKYLHYKIY